MIKKKLDLTSLSLHSLLFSQLVEDNCDVPELTEGTVYVTCHENDTWAEEVVKAKELLSESLVGNAFIFKYDCSEMPSESVICKDSKLKELIINGFNIVLPLYTPDRKTKVYLVGKIDNSSDLESAVSFMISDSEEIAKSCIMYSLLNMNPETLDNLIEELDEFEYSWPADNYMDDAKPSFACRGYHTPKAIRAFGESAVEARKKIKTGEISYEEGRQKLRKISSIMKKIQSADDPDKRKMAEKELGEAIAPAREQEMNTMFIMFLKRLASGKESLVDDIINSTTDRDALGQNSKYEIVLKKREGNRKPYKFQEDLQYWLFIKGQEGSLHPIKMQKTSMTIYILSLIAKVVKNKKYEIVDVKKNYIAYKKVNSILCHCYEEDAEKSFESLNLTDPFGRILEDTQGKLGMCYGDIESALQETFMELDENYSPYLISREFPLTIPKEKITLPEAFLNIKIK